MRRLTTIIAELLLLASSAVGCHAYPTREYGWTERPHDNEVPVYSRCEPHKSYCQVGTCYEEGETHQLLLRMYASAVVLGKSQQPPEFQPFFVEQCDLWSHITNGCDGVEQVGSFKPSREIRTYPVRR